MSYKTTFQFGFKGEIPATVNNWVDMDGPGRAPGESIDPMPHTPLVMLRDGEVTGMSICVDTCSVGAACRFRLKIDGTMEDDSTVQLGAGEYSDYEDYSLSGYRFSAGDTITITASHKLGVTTKVKDVHGYIEVEFD